MQQVLIAGRYRLLDLVGRGGMGRVWRARDEMLHREVAVKQVVPPRWLADQERAELGARTLREARTAARLNHPNVVRIYDVVQVDESPWIIMEYVPSRSLQEIVDADGPLAPRRAAGVGLAVLAALRAAHTAGVLHRDVKPPNVLVAGDGRVLLTDFGLAVFDGGDGRMTRPGMVLGSPQYVAPERAAEGVSSVKADLWSLGATLHAAVEGQSPYARSTAMATLSALASQPPDPAPHAGPLRPVLDGLLQRDPRRRIDHDETWRRLTAVVTPPPAPSTVLAPLAVAPAAAVPGSEAVTQLPPLPAPPSAQDPAGPGRGAPVEQDYPGAGPQRPRTGARRWILAAGAFALAVAAGAGTALAVTRESDDGPAGQPSAVSGARPPGGGRGGDPVPDGGPGGDPGRAPDPGPPGPPPGGRGVPPPPFACVRPDPVGQPVRAAAPAPDERYRPPEGWMWHADSDGFRVAVPTGWWYSREREVACFRDPVTGRTLSVAPAGDATATAVTRLRSAERRAIDAGLLPGYDKIRLAAADRGAEWECRWDTPHGSRLHALQLVPGADARGWTLGWITDDRDWRAGTADLAVIRRSFRPAREG